MSCMVANVTQGEEVHVLLVHFIRVAHVDLAMSKDKHSLALSIEMDFILLS